MVGSPSDPSLLPQLVVDHPLITITVFHGGIVATSFLVLQMVYGADSDTNLASLSKGPPILDCC
jgi:hypothetical protein